MACACLVGGIGHSGAAVEEGAQIGFVQLVAAQIYHLIHLRQKLQHCCIVALPAGFAGFGNDVQLGVAINRGNFTGILGAHRAFVLLLPLQSCPRGSTLLMRSLLLLLRLVLVLVLVLMGHSPLWPVGGVPLLLLVRWSPCRPARGTLVLEVMLIVSALLLLRV